MSDKERNFTYKVRHAQATPDATPTPSVTRCSQLKVKSVVRPSKPSRLVVGASTQNMSALPTHKKNAPATRAQLHDEKCSRLQLHGIDS